MSIIFNVLVESKGEAYQFVDESRKNFYDSRPEVKAFIRDYRIIINKPNKKDLVITGLVSVGLPPLYLLGFLFCAIAFIFNAFFWLVPAGVFFFTGLLFTPIWYALMFYVGLKKKGYRGRVKFISSGKVLEVILFGAK